MNKIFLIIIFIIILLYYLSIKKEENIFSLAPDGTTCAELGSSWTEVEGVLSSCKEAISSLEGARCSGNLQSASREPDENVDKPSSGGSGCYCDLSTGIWKYNPLDNSMVTWAGVQGRQFVCKKTDNTNMSYDSDSDCITPINKTTTNSTAWLTWPFTGSMDNGSCAVVTNHGSDGLPDFIGPRVTKGSFWTPDKTALGCAPNEVTTTTGDCEAPNAVSPYVCKPPEVTGLTTKNITWQHQPWVTRRQVLQKALGWFVWNIPQGSCGQLMPETCADPNTSWPKGPDNTDSYHPRCPYHAFSNPDCCALVSMVYKMGYGCGATGHHIPWELAQPGDIYNYGGVNEQGGHHVALFRYWKEEKHRLFFDEYDPSKENNGLIHSEQPGYGAKFYIWELGGGGGMVNTKELVFKGNHIVFKPTAEQQAKFGADLYSGYGPLEHWLYTNIDADCNMFIYRFGRILKENGEEEPWKGHLAYATEQLENGNYPNPPFPWN